MHKISAALISFGFLACTSQAHASVIATFTKTLPLDTYVAPASTSGSVLTNVVGTQSNRKSPFQDNTSAYVAVERGYATYTSPGLSDELSLVWGTPDKYNTIVFLNGAKVVDSITGLAIGGGLGRDNYFTTLRTTELFNAVELVSTGAAFEFSNVALSAVPLPASAPMFGAALVGLGLAGTRLKRSAAV